VVKTRTRLSRGQVSAIQHLVAAAVAGLTANMSRCRRQGELLAGGNDGDNGFGGRPGRTYLRFRRQASPAR